MLEPDELARVPVREGDLLDGKYEVERILGSGGLGVVVAARHLQLERRVALKFLLPDIMSNRDAVARFSREARAAARLRGEHVTRVLDVGTLASGAPYMVMEYLEGCDLARLLEERGRLPVAEAVTYLLQACSAIAEAHAAGIVHRDLKPANLFLTTASDGGPHVKVLDFGISKTTMAMEALAALSLTSSSAVMGTPLYMSPEQMQSARGVDSRADVWSLGAILYELIDGEPPFHAASLPELCIAVMQQEPRPLHLGHEDVPPELSPVVARCLTKERSRRFASVAALAEALAPFAPSEQAHLVRRIVRVSLPPAGEARSADAPRAPTTERDAYEGAGDTLLAATHTPETRRSEPEPQLRPASSGSLALPLRGGWDRRWLVAGGALALLLAAVLATLALPAARTHEAAASAVSIATERAAVVPVVAPVGEEAVAVAAAPAMNAEPSAAFDAQTSTAFEAQTSPAPDATPVSAQRGRPIEPAAPSSGASTSPAPTSPRSAAPAATRDLMSDRE